jgi:hypothetical protein
MKYDVVPAHRLRERGQVERVASDQLGSARRKVWGDELKLADAEIVEDADRTALDELIDQVASDEAGPSDDKRSHSASLSSVFFAQSTIARPLRGTAPTSA